MTIKRMQQRRGTAANWTSTNPVLSPGELGVETDTGKVKVGNGSSAWNALAYVSSGGGDVKSVKDFGAKGDGTTDDTTAITAALAAGGTTYFPPGTYIHTGLTLGNGAKVRGAGYGSFTYGTPPAAGQRSILKLKAGTNADNITVAAGTSYGVIEMIEIDGNRANNSGSYVGLRFAHNVSALECGWRVNDIEIHDISGVGLMYEYGRQGAYFHHILINSIDEHGVIVQGTDTTWNKLMVGWCGYNTLIAGGGANRFIGGDQWGLAGNGSLGCAVQGEAISFVGVGFDNHDGDAMLIDTTAKAISVAECSFRANGLGTNNTYADIVLATSNAIALTGNMFGGSSGGNRRRWAIETAGNSVIAIGNAHDATGTATAYCDTPANLKADAQTLTGTVLTNPVIADVKDANGNEVLQFGATASAVNYFGVANQILGDSPTLSAQGVDTNIDGTFVPKGTGGLRQWVNSQPNAKLIAAGSSTDVGYDVQTKGAGRLTVNTVEVDTRATATAASSATPTPAITAARQQFSLTALAANATFAAPTGTPRDGYTLTFRIKDNATSRTLAWNAIYRAVGVLLPTATAVSKTLYVGCVYNSADTKWDVVAVGQEV